MSLVEMVMPKMGESIIEASVIRWLKKVGDKIERDESVLEVATDKVDTEVPAIEGGILHEILVKEGEIAKVGAPIAIISTQKVTISQNDGHAAQQIIADIEHITKSYVQQTPEMQPRFYSPLVLNIAREEGIALQELERIPGTGKENRVTKNDILDYIKKRKNQVEIASSAIENGHSKPDLKPAIEEQKNIETIPEAKIEKSHEIPFVSVKPAISYSGEHEIIEMDWMRKIISQRMLDSQRISATVTSFVEADVTNMVFWRNKIKHEFLKQEGEGITYTPLLIEAVAKALKEFPLVNSSIEGDKIIVKKDINIGMAVALQDGNLIVPVVRNADRYNIVGLTKYVNELIKKARNNKLKPEDMADGTYTLSNIGGFGNVMGTPIIVQPQVAIMAAGAIRKKPAVIETEYGDTLGIRHFMFLSHSYDHRIVDGALGGSFVKKVANLLENFNVKRKL
ncbi:MAG: dihydrolipoamide acetyltransferase family protein [Cytophagales bacterium]